MIPERYAAFLEALRAHFRDKEIRPLDVLKAAQTNQALGLALIARYTGAQCAAYRQAICALSR